MRSGECSKNVASNLMNTTKINEGAYKRLICYVVPIKQRVATIRIIYLSFKRLRAAKRWIQ